LIIETDDDVADKVVVAKLKEILLREDCLNRFEEEHFLYVLEHFVTPLEFDKFLMELDESEVQPIQRQAKKKVKFHRKTTKV